MNYSLLLLFVIVIYILISSLFKYFLKDTYLIKYEDKIISKHKIFL